MAVTPLQKPEETPQAATHKALLPALLAAQKAYGALKRETQGQRGKYAPLDRVLDVVVKALNANGVLLSQPTALREDLMIVVSELTHVESGASKSGEYPVGRIDQKHIDLGAGLTWARRFGLMALCGIYPEGEDRAAASNSRAGARTEQAPTDYYAAIAQLQVKMLNTTTLEELDRVWSANRRLRDAIAKNDPTATEPLERRYKVRQHELSSNRGSLFQEAGE